MMPERTTIIVVDYDPEWPAAFARLRDRIRPAVADLASTIEHVGSTAVPGLAAKPVIDINIVVPDRSRIPAIIERICSLGYAHLGDLGVPEREAFRPPADDSEPRHNLYASPVGCIALRNHLALRDYLRDHPDEAHAYGRLKKQLAAQFPRDIDSYIDGKTDFIIGILKMAGMPDEDIRGIASVNRKPDG